MALKRPGSVAFDETWDWKIDMCDRRTFCSDIHDLVRLQFVSVRVGIPALDFGIIANNSLESSFSQIMDLYQLGGEVKLYRWLFPPLVDTTWG
jgi:hypothetical protein